MLLVLQSILSLRREEVEVKVGAVAAAASELSVVILNIVEVVNVVVGGVDVADVVVVGRNTGDDASTSSDGWVGIEGVRPRGLQHLAGGAC